MRPTCRDTLKAQARCVVVYTEVQYNEDDREA